MTARFPIASGLSVNDVPADILPEAARARCCEDAGRPEEGFGYAGGGFGPYKVCQGCGKVFAKRAARDGNGR